MRLSIIDRMTTRTESSLRQRRINVRMTNAMYANLRRLAGDDKQIAELIRVAIREYLDNQGELTGSRRYFTGRFRDEVRLLREETNWRLALIIVLLSEMLSLLIRGAVKFDDEETAKKFTASGVLRMAEERLVESGHRVQERVADAIDRASTKAQRSEDGSS